MKKTLIVLVSFSILISYSAYTQDYDYLEASVEKAQRGIVNSLTGWLEIPIQVTKGYKNGFGSKG